MSYPKIFKPDQFMSYPKILKPDQFLSYPKIHQTRPIHVIS
jgi:hypothetical protein